MSRVIARASLALALTVCTAGLVGLQQAQPPARDWSPRLESMDPGRPFAYFELAEEIADAARTPEEREIARTLYGLAGALDRDRLGRSAALGVAGLTDDARLRRRLRAVASLLAAESEEAGFEGTPTRPSAAGAVALSECFSHFRRGQGPRASSMAKAPEVSLILDQYGNLLPGGADRFREDCRTFRGGVRPELAPAHLQAMFAIEEAVLASVSDAQDRGWGSVVIETSGRPLLEVDVARLDEAFGVDPRRVYWRRGFWTDKP